MASPSVFPKTPNRMLAGIGAPKRAGRALRPGRPSLLLRDGSPGHGRDRASGATWLNSDATA
eukprot:11207321-Lingulodinium_polyedra.AAC.1